MNKVLNFLKEVKAEFKQISWPKRESIIQSTIVVISISIVVSLILGGFDYLFTQAIGFVGSTGTQKSAVPTSILSPTAVPTAFNLPTQASKTKK